MQYPYNTCGSLTPGMNNGPLVESEQGEGLSTHHTSMYNIAWGLMPCWLSGGYARLKGLSMWLKLDLDEVASRRLLGVIDVIKMYKRMT